MSDLTDIVPRLTQAAERLDVCTCDRGVGALAPLHSAPIEEHRINCRRRILVEAAREIVQLRAALNYWPVAPPPTPEWARVRGTFPTKEDPT